MFAGGAQSLPMAANPTAAGTRPTLAAPPSQPADKYSAIADLESVFSSTSVSGGFGFQSVGVNWAGGGAASMWAPQSMAYNSDNTSQPANMGRTVPQMFGVNSATNSTVAPPSYAAVAGNPTSHISTHIHAGHSVTSVIFVLIYFFVLVLVFQLFFSFSFVLVLQYFFILVLVLPTTK